MEVFSLMCLAIPAKVDAYTKQNHQKKMQTEKQNPSRLTDEDLREFIAIYKKEFNEELSLEQARAIAEPFLELYAMLAHPLASERLEAKRQELEKQGKKASISGDRSGSIFLPSPSLVIDIQKPRRPGM